MFYIWFMAFLIYFELYSFILYVLRNVHDDNLRFELIEMTPIIIYSRERVRVIKSEHFFFVFSSVIALILDLKFFVCLFR